MEGGDDSRIRTGTLWTAVVQLITATLGTSILAFPWSMSHLGWLVGPFSILFFSAVNYYTGTLLCDCYRIPDPENGRRNNNYIGAVRAYLGAKHVIICGIAQYTLLWGAMVSFTITAATSMGTLKKLKCFNEKGHDANCSVSGILYYSIAGGIEIVLSQFPSMEKVTVLSIIMSATTFGYVFITSYICIAKFASHPKLRGDLLHLGINNGIATSTKVFDIFQALGNIAFAYTCCDVLLEVEDTLKSPPSENKTMKKVTMISISMMTVFYLTLACMGYLSFGNNAPGNILAGVYEPAWLVQTANILVIIHLMSSYRVLAQPLYGIHERWLASKWPSSGFCNKVYVLRLPYTEKGTFQFTLGKLVLRPVFVIFTTIVAMIFPFFNEILGLLGAISFWPLTVYFPMSTYMMQVKIAKTSVKWKFMQSLSMLCLMVTLISGVGSVVGIVERLKHTNLFEIQL